mgnify:FL=1
MLVCDDIGYLSLTKGDAAYVDAADLPLVAGFNWHIFSKKNTSYAMVALRATDGSWRKLLLHRLLMVPEAGLVVDHIDGNGLDNRRSNLRTCSNAENSRNRRKAKGGTSSSFKGVARFRNGWQAQIIVDGKNLYLGRYQDEHEAALAYDAAAVEHFGEYALTNAGLGLLAVQRSELLPVNDNVSPLNAVA